MSHEIDWELLFRYRGGACTAEERARFEWWLAADPRHRVWVDAAVAAAGDALASLDALPHRPAASRSRPVLRRSFLAAAVPVAAAVVAWASVGRPWRAAGDAPAWCVTSASLGERRVVDLADGTRVVLGAGSTLRHPVAFARGAREVVLVGEAYFVVAHDARRPFRVRAGDALAEDLGTAFGVRAYPEEGAVQVVVAEGRVALGRAADSTAPHGAAAADATVLRPGERGRLRRGGRVPVVERVDVDAELAWTRGRLVFDETPLADALARLGRWFAVELVLADSTLAAQRLTATFAGESLDEALPLLEAALGVRAERTGAAVVLRRVER